ncbi:hypothetical protein ACHAPJ_005026 [Fusarium lateritium]
MTQAVKRACDACHRRKVKCDGINPCRNCSTASLSCTYNAIPQKKGPKGSRAKVISELRENQRQTSLAARVHNRLHGLPCPTTVTPALNPTPGLVSGELIKMAINFYFDNLYAQLPILDRAQTERHCQFMDQSRDSYCLITSLCAFMMLQPGMTMPPVDSYNIEGQMGANIVSSQLLLEECLRVRKGADFYDSINLNVLATNFFLFGCYYSLEMHDKAWYYLREATTMIHMAGMNKEEHYGQIDASEAIRRRRLFWLLFVTERSYAVQRHHPLSLQATIHPSSMGDDPADAMYPNLNNFFILCNLYRPIDDAFLVAWRHGCRHLDAQAVTTLQKQLQERTNPYNYESNFIGDQQWIKNTLWQLNGNAEDSMSFQYPHNMTQELLARLASSFPNQGMELMGSGIIPKLFETCLNLTEVLINMPQPRDPYAIGPRQWLSQILSNIDAIRAGDVRYLPCLLSKVTEVLPRVVDPMLKNAPENVAFKMANVDIFDGFGNAGMAQMPMDEYNQGLPMDDYETKYQDLSGNTPDSLPNSNASNGTPPGTQPGNDMNTPFVSSPGVMSPEPDSIVCNGINTE